MASVRRSIARSSHQAVAPRHPGRRRSVHTPAWTRVCPNASRGVAAEHRSMTRSALIAALGLAIALTGCGGPPARPTRRAPPRRLGRGSCTSNRRTAVARRRSTSPSASRHALRGALVSEILSATRRPCPATRLRWLAPYGRAMSISASCPRGLARRRGPGVRRAAGAVRAGRLRRRASCDRRAGRRRSEGRARERRRRLTRAGARAVAPRALGQASRRRKRTSAAGESASTTTPRRPPICAPWAPSRSRACHEREGALRAQTAALDGVETAPRVGCHEQVLARRAPLTALRAVRRRVHVRRVPVRMGGAGGKSAGRDQAAADDTVRFSATLPTATPRASSSCAARAYA